MKMSLRIDGGQELAARLGRLEQSLSRKIKVEALREAAEPIRATAPSLAPRDASAKAPHLADNIVIGTLTEKRLERIGRESETVVEVGPAAGKGGDDFFYGLFQEFGTAFHPAQPFLRPAFDAWAPRSLSILVSSLWRALKAGIPSSGGGRGTTESIAARPQVTFSGVGSRRAAPGTGGQVRGN